MDTRRSCLVRSGGKIEVKEHTSFSIIRNMKKKRKSNEWRKRGNSASGFHSHTFFNRSSLLVLRETRDTATNVPFPSHGLHVYLLIILRVSCCDTTEAVTVVSLIQSQLNDFAVLPPSLITQFFFFLKNPFHVISFLFLSRVISMHLPFSLLPLFLIGKRVKNF